jgi:S-adenosylmethionine:tRNA ribosyltransferase-isomerase
MAAAGQTTWTCMVGNARKWRYGEALVLRTANPQAELTARLLNAADGRYEVQFRWTPAAWPFSQVLEHFGATPLPPYLRRPAEAADRARYQTVYAQAEGAVAAPTAGLHFTERLLQQLAARGIATERLTLHVGAGTFRPVTSEDPAGHPMHAEEFSLAPAALRRLAAHAGPLVAVGTTSLRLLESAYWLGVRALREEQLPQAYVPQWLPYHQPAPLPGMAEAYTALAEAIEAAGLERLYGATQLMILPGYPFATARGLITNFHLPRSTLLLLIAAFVGHDWKRLYETALANNFRFLSYGDGSLLWRPARLV